MTRRILISIMLFSLLAGLPARGFAMEPIGPDLSAGLSYGAPERAGLDAGGSMLLAANVPSYEAPNAAVFGNRSMLFPAMQTDKKLPWYKRPFVRRTDPSARGKSLLPQLGKTEEIIVAVAVVIFVFWAVSSAADIEQDNFTAGMF